MVDYLLKVVVSGMASFDALYLDLTVRLASRNVTSRLSMESTGSPAEVARGTDTCAPPSGPRYLANANMAVRDMAVARLGVALLPCFQATPFVAALLAGSCPAAPSRRSRSMPSCRRPA